MILNQPCLLIYSPIYNSVAQAGAKGRERIAAGHLELRLPIPSSYRILGVIPLDIPGSTWTMDIYMIYNPHLTIIITINKDSY